MHIAGLVLDIYDQTENGLLAHDQEQLKTAGLLSAKLCSPEALSHLPDSDFGLVGMTKSGSLVRKFPLHDSDSTKLSAFYFAKNYRKLPPKVAEVVAVRIHDACARHKVASPLGDVEVAQDELERAIGLSPIDLERADGYWLAKTATEPREEDYVLVEHENGVKVGHYHVPDQEALEEAAGAFESGGWKELAPNLRVKIAMGLKGRLEEAGLPLPEKVATYSSSEVSSEIGHWLQARKRLVPHTSWGALDDMFDKQAAFTGHQLGAALEVFDRMHGLHEHWDRGVRDPYRSCYSAPRPPTIKVGSIELTEDQICDLARDTKKLASFFSLADIAEIQKNPVDVFNSLPEPTKELLAEAVVG